jgi:hypothetical protein
MRPFSQRRAFTLLNTVFATTFCIAITGQVLGGEADLLADILKIAILIALGTAVISFTAWTLTHLKTDSVKRGAAAGVLSAIAIIPLPAFVANLKTLTLSAYEGSADSLISAFFSALPPSINAGLYTFVDITKASLIAVVASLLLGAVIAYFIAPRPAKVSVPRDENSQSPL